MSRPLKSLAALAALGALLTLGAALTAQTEPPARSAGGPAPSTPTPADVSPEAGAASAVATRPVAHTWSLDAAQRVELDGEEVAHRRVLAAWTVVPMGPERVQVELDVQRIDGPQMPPVGQLERPFQLGTTDGRLDRIGFEDAVGPAARNLLAELATEMTWTPGEGPEWHAEEVDLNGHFVARYRALDDDRFERVRQGFLSAHTARGAGRPDGLSADGVTRYWLDAAGLARIRVEETIRRDFAQLGLKAAAAVRLDAERIASQPVDPPTRRLALRPIAPVIDPAGLLAAERNRIGDADLETVMGWLAETEGLPEHADEGARIRAGVHDRLRAFLRVHPERIADYVEALRRAPERQRILMLEALGAAGTAQATAGLVDVLTGLPAGDSKRAAHIALGLTKAPSAESVGVLLDDLDDPRHGTTAALAAANQVRALDGEAPEAADDVVGALLDRYTEAAGDAARGPMLGALGNTGDRRILPAVKDGLSRGAALARVAAYALRHVPGADVDAALQGLVFGGGLEAVRIQAARAVATRDRAHWTPILEAGLEQLGEAVLLRATVETILTRWAGRG